MSEQDSTSGDRLAGAAAENNPQAGSGERPQSGAERRTDPSQPTPAANQRAGEDSVEVADGVEDSEQGGRATSQTSAPTPPERAHGSSDAGSPAAAAGEVPVPAVEKSQDDAAGGTDSATHDRPVTGVHRPSAPSGEVSPH